MMVDSDDIVSDKIAAYCESHPNENGFLSKFGYLYNEGEDYVKKMHALHRTCGSCSICNYSIDDLPDSMPTDFYNQAYSKEYIFRSSHRFIPDKMKNSGRELACMPFPTTIYVRNTGDNHSMLNSDLNWKRKVELALERKIRIDSEEMSAFHII